MNVRVEFFGPLREAAGLHEIELTVPDGATVANLIDVCVGRLPALGARREGMTARANFDAVTADHVIRAGEVISLLPA